MIFLGLTLLFAGVIMNFKILGRQGAARRAAGEQGQRQITSAELMASPPWLISAGLVAAGLAIILFFH